MISIYFLLFFTLANSQYLVHQYYTDAYCKTAVIYTAIMPAVANCEPTDCTIVNIFGVAAASFTCSSSLPSIPAGMVVIENFYGSPCTPPTVFTLYMSIDTCLPTFSPIGFGTAVQAPSWSIFQQISDNVTITFHADPHCVSSTNWENTNAIMNTCVNNSYGNNPNAIVLVGYPTTLYCT